LPSLVAPVMMGDNAVCRYRHFITVGIHLKNISFVFLEVVSVFHPTLCSFLVFQVIHVKNKANFLSAPLLDRLVRLYCWQSVSWPRCESEFSRV